MTEILGCVDCNVMTTPAEAEQRVFNTNHCALCGGELKEVVLNESPTK